MVGKRPGKRAASASQNAPKQYDTTDNERQIHRDLDGAIRLGLMQAELLKSVQFRLEVMFREPRSR